ncbi:MAG: hypothetical protein GF330_04700 [Candidatus Eisenbacteria bacterium]|nr:hypothetical protein [Candidatus Eisenbacteria bacterium]
MPSTRLSYLLLAVPLITVGVWIRDGHGSPVQAADSVAGTLTADLECDGVTEEIRWLVRSPGRLELTLPPPHGRHGPARGVCVEIPPASSAPRLADLDDDGYQDLAGGPEGRTLLVPGSTWLRGRGVRDLGYHPIWDTEGDLRNVWDAELVDLDRDGRPEVMAQSYHYPGTLVHLYESTGDDQFARSWLGDTLGTPSLNSICGGDTDGDGQREAIAGEVGTLGRVYLWECTGDDQFAWRAIDVSMQPYEGAIKDVLLEDGDDDGRAEIVVCTGSAIDGSAVGLFEHDGAIGENRYQEVFAYETASYLFGIASGDSDNDGRREIVLNVGGVAGYPLYLRRLEYDPDTETYEHKMVTPGPIGLPLSAAVGNIDADPQNELVIGAGVPAGGAIYIFESSADDNYTLAWSSAFPIPGTPQDVALGPLNAYGYPTIAVSSFEGQIDIIGFDGSDYVRHLDPPLQIGFPVRSLDHGFADHPDALEDLVMAVSADDRVRVEERNDPTAIDEARGAGRHSITLRAAPNPFRGRTVLQLHLPGVRGGGSATPLAIHDASGRCVRHLDGRWVGPGRLAATWDGRGADGRQLPGGAYYVRSVLSEAVALPRLIHLR